MFNVLTRNITSEDVSVKKVQTFPVSDERLNNAGRLIA